MKKGIIFSARHHAPDDAVHPIIFWRMESQHEFVGLMITHATANRFGNLDLSNDAYFQSKRKKDEFDTSLIVQALLLKPVDWLIKPKIIGQLSEIGIKYVEGIVNGMHPITWDTYKLEIKR